MPRAAHLCRSVFFSFNTGTQNSILKSYGQCDVGKIDWNRLGTSQAHQYQSDQAGSFPYYTYSSQAANSLALRHLFLRPFSVPSHAPLSLLLRIDLFLERPDIAF